MSFNPFPDFCLLGTWLTFLVEQLDSMVGETEEESMTKEMLSTLVQFLT